MDSRKSWCITFILRFMALSIPFTAIARFLISLLFYIIQTVLDWSWNDNLINIIKSLISYWMWLFWLLSIPLTIVGITFLVIRSK